MKHLLGGSSLTLTNGYAGAGKSTSMRIAAEVANSEVYTVIVSGPTHRSCRQRGDQQPHRSFSGRCLYPCGERQQSG
ncbi:AAA family ATPase, partial [Rhizobium ruizarguesonis]